MKNLQKVARNPLLWVVLALVFVIGEQPYEPPAREEQD